MFNYLKNLFLFRKYKCKDCKFFVNVQTDIYCREENYGFCNKIKNYYEPRCKNRKRCLKFKENKYE